MRARWLWAVPVLLLSAGAMYASQFAAAGVMFMEPLAFACDAHAPAGWYEATDATGTWTGTPPKLTCHMVNGATGETAYWDSGSATTAPWLLMWASLLGTAVVAGGVVVPALRRSARGATSPRS